MNLNREDLFVDNSLLAINAPFANDLKPNDRLHKLLRSAIVIKTVNILVSCIFTFDTITLFALNMWNITEFPKNFDHELWSQILTRSLEDEPGWVSAIFVTAMMVIFGVSIVGNLLTCIVIYYDKTMHTATNYYLFNLAISDLIVTFGILLEVYEYMTESYQFGDIVCKMHFFFVVVLWNNSILIMTTLAIERYIAIWYPLMLQSKPIWRRVTKVIVIVWIIAIAETLPEIWTVSLIKTKKSSICYTIPTPYARVINGILALVTFVIPLVIMTFVYVMIAFKVNNSEKSNPGIMVFNHKDNRKKVNKLIALTLSFLVCWLPFFTLRVLIFACDVNNFAHLFQYLGTGHRIILFNNWFSMVLNPVLFSLMSTKFREALKMLWKSKTRGLSTNVIKV